ncbi:MAG: hypothetical protein RLZ98_2821 [Pseudomonadota bacterium]|jgi:mannose-6-phosphate isomerase-like protein (cupin superfamily)
MAESDGVRRVVTTVDDTGKAVVLFDGPAPRNSVRPVSGNTSRLLWVTETVPVDISGPKDRGDVEIGTQPPAGGTVFRIVDYPPEPEEVSKLDPGFRQQEIGKDAPSKGLPPRHPMMHRTRSVDYAVIMEGEIDMLLDDSEIHLKAGDVLVQQGTNHAWVNRSGKRCRIAFILVDAKDE